MKNPKYAFYREYYREYQTWVLLRQACIAGFVKHLSLCTGHNSGWIMAYALAFAHGKRITEYCSLRDTLNGIVAAFNVDKWRHSDVIVIKLTAGTQDKILYKTYIWIFHPLKICCLVWPKLRCFVTYLWNILYNSVVLFLYSTPVLSNWFGCFYAK